MSHQPSLPLQSVALDLPLFAASQFDIIQRARHTKDAGAEGRDSWDRQGRRGPDDLANTGCSRGYIGRQGVGSSGRLIP